MDKIPDAWPPDPTDAGVRTAPLFPLPNVWLFPRVVLPLHVFEPRYREMIEDSMDGPGRIVMGTIIPGHEGDMPASPPVHSVAGVGEILRHDKTPDGRYIIQLLGLERVTLTEVESDKPYRQVAYEPLPEAAVSAEDDAELRGPLLAALQRRVGEALELPDDVPLGVLADVLLIRLALSHEQLHLLYAEADPVRRTRGALAAEALAPPRNVGDDDREGDRGDDEDATA
jgi:Lon protease-like protein